MSTFRVFSQPRLRSWYRKTVLRTAFSALLVLVALLLSGAFVASFAAAHATEGLLAYWGKHLSAAMLWLPKLAASLLWMILLFFMSGTLTVTLMNAFVGVMGSERELLSAVDGLDTPAPLLGLRKISGKDRRHEYAVLLRTLIFSLLLWPLFFIPVLIPLEVLIFAWSLGAMALATGRRLCHQNAEMAREDVEEGQTPPTTAFYALGLGLIPACALLFPFAGWAALPLLQIAGYCGQRVPTAQNPMP